MAATHPDITPRRGIVPDNYDNHSYHKLKQSKDVHSYPFYGNNVWMFIFTKYLLTYFLRVLLNKNMKRTLIPTRSLLAVKKVKVKQRI